MNANPNDNQPSDRSAKEKVNNSKSSSNSESQSPTSGKEKKSKRNFFSRAKMFNSRREKKSNSSGSDGSSSSTTKKCPKWTNPFNYTYKKMNPSKPSTSKHEQEEIKQPTAISLEYLSTNPCCVNQMKEVVEVEIVTMNTINEQQLTTAASNVTAVVATVKSPIKNGLATAAPATIMLPVVKEEDETVEEVTPESKYESLPKPSKSDSDEEYMEMIFQPDHVDHALHFPPTQPVRQQQPKTEIVEKDEACGGELEPEQPHTELATQKQQQQQQNPQQPAQQPQLKPEARQFPEIPTPHVHIEKAEGVRGIYATAMNANGTPTSIVISAPFVDTHLMRMVHEDCDEAARIARAREIEQGVDPPANYRPIRRLQVLCSEAETENGQTSQTPPRRLQIVCPPDLNVETLKGLFQNHVTLRSCPLDSITGCHTQVDFIHCLVPDLMDITNCSFYWGKMDRYEAERLLEGKPEGTFLLRDSAQDEYLFSVSFRKYGRSLHARIEQWNHRFSFDSHDPGVYTSDSVCGLIEHYKDPSSCMFFEPMLTWPLHRNFTFPLQHLARASIVSRLTYDNINHLQLPKTLKSYLKEYHYRQKVRVENFDDDVQWLELRNMPP